jgi:hypothetical protein
MAVIHIPEEEAVRDFGAVLSKIDAGNSIVIDRGATTVVLESSKPMRTIAEALEILKNLPGERAVMDEDFAADVRFAMERMRTPPRTSPWD